MILSPALTLFSRFWIRSLVAFFCMAIAPVSPANASVDVKDIHVDVTSKTGLQARDLGIITAKRKAFDKLVQSHEFLAEKRKGKAQPTDKFLDDITETFEVHSEKISATRYIGVFTITFTKAGIDQILTGRDIYSPSKVSSNDTRNTLNTSENASHTNNQDRHNTDIDNKVLKPQTLETRDVILVPLYVTPDESFLWTKNPWREFWQHSPHDDVLTTTIPLGDLRDILSISVEDLMTNRSEKGAALLARYNKKTILFVSLKRYSDTGGDADLIVKIFKKGQVIFISEPLPVTAASDVDLFEQARIETIKTIQNFETTASHRANTRGQTFSITAVFSTFTDWKTIRKALSLSEINSFSISQLTTKSAQLSIHSSVSYSQLQALFHKNGLSLQEGILGHYSLSLLLDSSAPSHSPALPNTAQPAPVLR